MCMAYTLKLVLNFTYLKSKVDAEESPFNTLEKSPLAPGRQSRSHLTKHPQKLECLSVQPLTDHSI